MDKIVLNSKLSNEEIQKNFEGFDFFGELSESLHNAVDHAEGKDNTKVMVHRLKLPIINVSEIRKSLNMTQKSFADVLGVSKRTVEAWEAGKTNPTPTAKKLIYLIDQDHSVISKLVNE